MLALESIYEIYLKHPSVTTDSRQITEGCLFFALRGDHFDGNTFAKKALEQGAAYVVVDDATVVENDRYILVPNSLITLQQLARHHRRQLGITVVAITGSNGKTTTKELVSNVLSSQYKTHFTKGNLNNHIGVPLTLLAMPESTEIAVVEMGANHQKEIAFLCTIAEPTHGLITNIGKAHIEGFGGIEGIKKGKSELYEYLAQNKGMVFVNLDEPFLLDLVKEKGPARFLQYMSSDEPSPSNIPFEIKLIKTQPFIKVAFLSENKELTKVKSHLIGVYNFNNIMTAITLGKYFKVPAAKIKSVIESYVPTNNRSQLIEKEHYKIVLDAYNANPTSMKGAVDSFIAMKSEKKAVILGAMKELGADTELEHQALTDLVMETGVLDCIALVGAEYQTARREGIYYFDSVETLKSWYTEQDWTDYLILIKGSRSNQLEKVLA